MHHTRFDVSASNTNNQQQLGITMNETESFGRGEYFHWSLNAYILWTFLKMSSFALYERKKKV